MPQGIAHAYRAHSAECGACVVANQFIAEAEKAGISSQSACT